MLGAVGTQMAIPAGTDVDCMVDAVTAHPRHGQMPSVKIHLMRLLFVNGYSTGIDAVNSEAVVVLPNPSYQSTYELADARDGAPYLGEGFAAAAGKRRLPVTAASIRWPSKAQILGLGLGATFGSLAIILAIAHHHANGD